MWLRPALSYFDLTKQKAINKKLLVKKSRSENTIKIQLSMLRAALVDTPDMGQTKLKNVCRFEGTHAARVTILFH